MESRGNLRRMRSRAARRHADPGDEPDAQHRHDPGEPDGGAEPSQVEGDFDEPRVVVTHSLHGPFSSVNASRGAGDAASPADPDPTPPVDREEGDGAAEQVVTEEDSAAPEEDSAAPEEDSAAPEKEEETAAAPPVVTPMPAPARSERPAEPAPEPSMPAPQGQVHSDARLSTDGEWWWNGTSWLPAVSNDGLWRWDGTRWSLQVASGLEPERLVEGLERLADVRYRRRGLLLAGHANDWPVPPELTRAMAEATEILEQRTGAERRLRAEEASNDLNSRRRGGFLRRSTVEERPRLRTEIDDLNRDLDPLLLQIGRDAPAPTFREADEVFETAQHLAAAAREVTACHEAVLAAQAEWQARVASSTADLEHRIAERDARIAEAEVGVREAEARREHQIADAWRRLAEVRMPGKGEHLASFGPVHLFAARVEMPNAAGPTAGARAVIGSAGELSRSERDALEDLFLVGDSGAADLHWAETNADPTPYLLVVTESGSALVPCGENESEARRFARQLASAAATADAMREARRRRLREATEAVERAERDRSEIDSAHARRRATEEDRELLEGIEKARERLAFDREETSDIDQTGAVLQGVLDRLTTAPLPLPTAGAG